MGLKRHMKASQEIYRESLKGDAKGNDYFDILVRHFPAWTFRWWAFLLMGFILGGIVVVGLAFGAFQGFVDHWFFG